MPRPRDLVHRTGDRRRPRLAVTSPFSISSIGPGDRHRPGSSGPGGIRGDAHGPRGDYRHDVAIPEEEVARVRSATDIVALISERAALKRQGRRFVGLCPFHSEKTPSFSVNAEEGLYYCFGCQRSGDAISFVREVEHLDFVDAVRLLADRAGIALTEDAAASGASRKRRSLLEAVERAVDWYHERLLSSPDAGPARLYLRSRGYDGDVVRKFRLGWAPDDWDALARWLGVDDEVLRDSGLGFVNRRGRQQDAFRARVMFPIFDPSGRPVGFGGRILPTAASRVEPGAAPTSPEAGSADPRPVATGHGPGSGVAGPKYKNSTESPVYSKRRILYGLNWAKHDVISTGEVVVCEGYTDVIGCFVSGIPRAVATCGTALGEEHFRLLANFAKRIVLAYDADSAGQAGAGRVYEWERHHQVDVAVAKLPGGSDPGELAMTDPEALRRAIADAQPFLRFRVERIIESRDLTTAEGRVRAAEAAMGTIAEHPNELVRDQYLMWVAETCRIDPERLRGHLLSPAASSSGRPPGSGPSTSTGYAGRAGRPPGSGPSTSTGQPEPTGGRDGEIPGAAAPISRRTPPGASRVSLLPNPGLEALCIALQRPEDVASLLDEVLFHDELQRRAFAALESADSLHEAIENADPEVGALLRRLAVEEPSGDVEGVVIQLVRDAARRRLVEIQAGGKIQAVRPGDATAGDGAANGGEAIAGIAAEIRNIRSELELLDDPSSALEACERLLAWLRGRDEDMR